MKHKAARKSRDEEIFDIYSDDLVDIYADDDRPEDRGPVRVNIGGGCMEIGRDVWNRRFA